MTKPIIGIIGGTFDPFHLGHEYLATSIYQLFNLQKILIIPCYQSPLRPPPIAPAQNRLHMIKLAIKDLPYIEVDSYELDRHTTSYTFDTLSYLHKKYLNSNLALIIGSDVFNTFDQWYKWQQILSMVHLIIIRRPAHNNITNQAMLQLLSQHETFCIQELQKNNSGLIYFANINPPAISATEIRLRVGNQKDISNLVKKDTIKYIETHKIYQP